MKNKQLGIDPTSTWKVVNYEGKVVVVKNVALDGFSGYAQAMSRAASHGLQKVSAVRA